MNKLGALIIIIFIIVGCISLRTYANMKIFEIHLIEENQELKFKLHMSSAQVVDPITEGLIKEETN